MRLANPFANPVRLLKALRGVRPVKPHPEKPIGSYNAHRVEIALDCGLTIDGELFVSGFLADPDPRNRRTGVEWFNAATSRWEVLWERSIETNWEARPGQILVPKLANGKTVVLPVEGL